MRTYLELLRVPYAGRLLGGTLFGRLPNGMGALAVLLLVRADGGGYGLAGALSAVYGLAGAAGQPVLGRWMDRRGQTRVLIGSATVSALAYVVFALVGAHPLPVAVAAVLVAGFTTPPLEAGLRALWPSVLTPERVQAAYALDAAAQEVLFTVGPLIVVVLVQLGSAQLAVVSTGLVGVVGTLIVATSHPSRVWRGEPHTPHWAGALRSPGLRVVLPAFALAGIALGVLSVAAVAYADREGSDALSGMFLAAMSFGALLGGLVHGVRAWRTPPARRLLWFMGWLTVCYLPLIVVPGPWVMMPLAVLSGVFLAPAIACVFTLIDELAPRGTVTEAFAWLVAAMGAGAALGMALAGWAGEVAGARGAFAVAGVGAGLGLLVLLAGRGRLIPNVIRLGKTADAELSRNGASSA
ncbi:MFS transporter [Embleya scabrispora]|uniref:MFS transporter n=2 Tax=Embleya scabrispora TaxID=159449 RepID=A0A1T3P5H5_9ACTN|nr:MFS transporter [Embleya scabrispora]